MRKDKAIKLLRGASFLVVFAALFVCIQNLVTPEWDWPNDGSRSSTAASGIYYEPNDTLEVLWVGTSHMHNAVSPMEIYRYSGIHSYNLATTGQPFLASYYRLESALKRQSPQVVMLDASSCFRSNFWQKSETAWRKMFDSLPWHYFSEKYRMAKGMIGLNPDKMSSKDIAGGLFPIIRYHSNYMLNRLDYLDRHRDMTYFLKGQAVITSTVPVDDNRPAGDGKGSDADALMKTLGTQAELLDRFIELCQRHNCRLVLTKIPVNTTENYEGYWDDVKHDIIEDLSLRLGVPFLDLNYEDIDIDWKTDTCDGGEHVNEKGARKISEFYANWLMKNCALTLSDDGKLKEKWDRQLEVFDYEHDRYWMEMEYDLDRYLENLAKHDYTVFTVVGGAPGDYWSHELQEAYAGVTGAGFDLSAHQPGDPCAYLCVSTNGAAIEEKSDEASCSVEGVLGDGAVYSASSRSTSAGGEGAVSINGSECLSKVKGIGFVVYDNELHCVVDAVQFDTTQQEKPCKRVDSVFLHPMREKMLEYEYRQLKTL